MVTLAFSTLYLPVIVPLRARARPSDGKEARAGAITAGATAHAVAVITIVTIITAITAAPASPAALAAKQRPRQREEP